MATRLKWSHDGTKAWNLNLTTWVRGTELTQANKDILDGDPYTGNIVSTANYCNLVFNFPQVVNLTSMSYKCDRADVGTIKVSNDSTNGIDGTWTTVNSDTFVSTALTTLIFSSSPDCRWLRIQHAPTPGNNYDYWGIWFFGEYKTPLYEFWNVGETAELTAEYPLALPDCPNSADYTQRMQFKIKNVDSIAHSYSVSIVIVKYSVDALVTDHITLSTNGGSTKLATVTISSLATGSFSGAIDVWGDITMAHNTANGIHYFAIEVTQT